MLLLEDYCILIKRLIVTYYLQILRKILKKNCLKFVSLIDIIAYSLYCILCFIKY